MTKTKDQKWEDKIMEICARHGDGREYGYFLSEKQFKELFKLVRKEISKAREEGWQSGHKQTKEDVIDKMETAIEELEIKASGGKGNGLLWKWELLAYLKK